MKIARHAKIIDLISRNDVETQEELADLLNGEGFRVTQATVSRDIRELKLTKISLNDGRQKYAVMQASREKYERKIFKDSQRRFPIHGYGPEHSGGKDRIRDGHGGGCFHRRHAVAGGGRVYRGG